MIIKYHECAIEMAQLLADVYQEKYAVWPCDPLQYSSLEYKVAKLAGLSSELALTSHIVEPNKELSTGCLWFQA